MTHRGFRLENHFASVLQRFFKVRVSLILMSRRVSRLSRKTPITKEFVAVECGFLFISLNEDLFREGKYHVIMPLKDITISLKDSKRKEPWIYSIQIYCISSRMPVTLRFESSCSRDGWFIEILRHHAIFFTNRLESEYQNSLFKDSSKNNNVDNDYNVECGQDRFNKVDKTDKNTILDALIAEKSIKQAPSNTSIIRSFEHNKNPVRSNTLESSKILPEECKKMYLTRRCTSAYLNLVSCI